MSENHSSTDKNSPLLFLFIYLFFSFFTGLIFSILSLRAKKREEILKKEMECNLAIYSNEADA